MTPGVPRLASPLLAELPGLRHAFFSRRGGVSDGLYASLNVGRGSGDAPDRVRENRMRAAGALGLDADALAIPHQVHSAKAVRAALPFDGRPPEADAVATASPRVLCGVLAADCAPVLIADPEARVAAAAHAGWRGALAGVVEAAVEAMEALGGRRRRMSAAVGPCIGPASYEVGLELMEAFVAADAANARLFAAGAAPDKRLFDLPAYVLSRLAAAGIARAEWIGRDTFAEADWFFSNRRAVRLGEADYGRQLSAIAFDR